MEEWLNSYLNECAKHGRWSRECLYKKRVSFLLKEIQEVLCPAWRQPPLLKSLSCSSGLLVRLSLPANRTYSTCFCSVLFLSTVPVIAGAEQVLHSNKVTVPHTVNRFLLFYFNKGKLQCVWLYFLPNYTHWILSVQLMLLKNLYIISVPLYRSDIFEIFFLIFFNIMQLDGKNI